jgi:hypothetical protein
MKYISIGTACQVKYNIDKFISKSETLFFDWLITSMTTVIDILSCDDIKNILFFDNIKQDIKNPYAGYNSQIIVKTLDCFVSTHDLPKNYTNEDIFNFIDKYTNRFNRIIDFIKLKEHICFVRYTTYKIEQEEINKFIKAILNINNECNFTLVIIHNKNNNNSNEIIKNNHLLYININVDNSGDDWTLQNINWKQIFIDIENNIETNVL